MKKFLSYLFASILGGLIVIWMQYLIVSKDFPQERVQQLPGYATPISQINQSPSRSFHETNFREGAKRAMPAVVHISVKAKNELPEDNLGYLYEERFFNPFQERRFRQGSGSGVIYTPDGFIITNYHVIKNAESIEVRLFDNRKFEATVAGFEEKIDIAVLKIEAIDLPTLELYNSDLVEVGDWALAVGNPFDLTSTVTAGIISAKGRDINLLTEETSIETFLQTDAVINPGNSGGALVNTSGALIGINTAIATRTGVFSGYAFAIPINLVKRIVDDIIEYGDYQQAYLGIQSYELDSEIAKGLGLNISQGVVIDEVEEGGSAQFAGLRPKDVIIKANGKTIRGIPQLQEVVSTAKIGDVLDIVVNRKNVIIEIPVTLRPE